MKRTNKYNYIEIVNQMVPEVYRNVDFKQFGSEEDISITFLGKILKAGVESDRFFSGISDLTGGTFTSSALAPYFVPSNAKTYITPQQFSNKVLSLYGKSFDSFSSTSSLHHFVSGTFLPDAELGNPSGLFTIMSGIGDGKYSSLSLVHNYLIENLGMFYFMNTSSMVGDSGGTLYVDPSSLITEAIVGSLEKGKAVTEKQAIDTLFSYFWHNREVNTYCKSFIPVDFASGTSDISALTYASGTQLLKSVHIHLNTWTDSLLEDHSFLGDSMSLLLGGGAYPTIMRDAGSFQRFLKAVSLGIADMNLILEEISDLLSIDDCPERFLDLLANNIGWVFLTGEYSKWRAQLKNAVLVYKSKGSVLGMNAAFKLMFPDGMFSSSDLVECWESYLPRLIYYLLKTESFIEKNDLWTAPINELFPGGTPLVRFNQAPAHYANYKDRNCRFMVDAVLEAMHNEFGNIKINGMDFRSMKLWTCLPEYNRGFRHRNYPDDNPASNFNVAVPPWEKYGFYKGVELGKNEIDFICYALSGPREDFGFEVPREYVESLRTMLNEAQASVYDLSAKPEYCENNKVLFYTSGHQLPPNYFKFVKFGHTETAEDFDLWSTKSSTVFTTLELSSISNILTTYNDFKNRSSVQVYVDVLREFLPLHVTARTALYHDMEDEHCTGDTLCVTNKECLDTFNLGTLNSFRSSFFAGASGTGTFSSTVNEDGRVLPAASGEFWDATAIDLDRTASRRRNYRYSLPCYPYNRNGKAMPIAVTHYPFATSSSISGLGDDPYLNTWEYIVKGFNYNTQDFEAPSSTVWDVSGYFSGGGPCYVSGVTTSGYSLSDTYPVRAVPFDVGNCNLLPFQRDNLDGILKVITDRKIKIHSGDISSLQFGDLDYRTFPFGDSMHRSYHKYINEFSGVLSDQSVQGYWNYGGHNFVSYTYGPTVWNNDFRFKGNIIANTASLGPDGVNDPNLFDTYEAEWSSVVGGTTAGGQKYLNLSGTTVVLDPRTYFKDAPDAFNATSLDGVFRTTDDLGRPVYSTREILSGLELRQTGEDCDGFAVVSTAEPSQFNSKQNYSVTFYNHGIGNIELGVPFDPNTIGLPHYNKLRPQSNLRLDLFASLIDPEHSETLEVELLTSGLTDVDGSSITWGFNWSQNKWQVYSDSSKFTLFSRVPQPSKCVLRRSYDFNTYESSTEKSVPCGDPFFIGDVHTSSTGYMLKIRSGVPSNGMKGVTLHGISILDKLLNKSINNFNSHETSEIYNYWNTLAGGDFSRTPANITNTIFGAEGGSRAEYVELVGGSTYTSEGVNTGLGTSKSFYEYIITD